MPLSIGLDLAAWRADPKNKKPSQQRRWPPQRFGLVAATANIRQGGVGEVGVPVHDEGRCFTYYLPGEAAW